MAIPTHPSPGSGATPGAGAAHGGAERRSDPGAEPARPAARAAASRSRPRIRIVHWVFAGPAAVLFVVFFAYPLGVSLYQSFTTDDGGTQTWAGLAQYRRMLHDPVFWKSLWNTGLLLVFQVPLMIGLALVLACVLNQGWLRFKGTWRIAFFLPSVTMLVAYAVVFRVLLKTDGGMVNQVLGWFGVSPVDWLDDPEWARVSLIGTITWRWTGYNAVILLAGLQSIPREQYEAAAIDGAGAVTTFRKVVVPQLRPVILFCSITSTIGTLQLFDENFVLTKGGPDNATMTPVLYLYKVGFDQMDFSYASAIAWAVVLIIGVLSVIQFKFFGQSDAAAGAARSERRRG